MKKNVMKIMCLFFPFVMLCSGCVDNSNKIEDQGNNVGENNMIEFIRKQPMELWENTDKIPYYDSSVATQIPEITPFVVDNPSSHSSSVPCVIICPGGSYMKHAIDTEGYQIAEALNAKGIAAVVLKYRVAPYNYKAILSDVFRAIRFVRFYAKDFGIDPEKIAIMGFSAGGHLAAMALQHEPEIFEDEIDNVSAKVSCGILGYAVLSMKDTLTHQTTRANFLRNVPAYKKMIDKYSAELNVTADHPPCFIWTCKPDTGVSYRNSEKLAEVLNKNGIKCEFHLYEYGTELVGGGHGIGLARDCGDAAGWFDACIKFMREQW